jgi:hypothetical protein
MTCLWCDTSYSWDWTKFRRDRETRRGPVTEIASWVRAQGVDLVVVTGGEPMLQQAALQALVELCVPARVQSEKRQCLREIAHNVPLGSDPLIRRSSHTSTRHLAETQRLPDRPGQPTRRGGAWGGRAPAAPWVHVAGEGPHQRGMG